MQPVEDFDHHKDKLISSVSITVMIPCFWSWKNAFPIGSSFPPAPKPNYSVMAFPYT
jgi:hypothetical protein